MRKLFFVGLFASVAVATPVFAAHQLPPGDQGSPFAGASPFSLAPTGALLADTGFQNVGASVAGITLNTIMRAAVYNAGGGNLDFLYQISNLGTSNTSIDGLTFADFAGFTVSGAWQQLAAFGVFGTGVEEADSARRNLTGQTIGVSYGTTLFNDVDAGFSNLLNPGETSSIFQFRVAAASFRPGTFTAQDGIAVTGFGFSPVGAVPEPASWALMIIGFAGVGSALRRKRGKLAEQQPNGELIGV